MSVEPCSSCGGLFANLPRGVCANCLDRRERDFRAVRDWLRDNRGAPIAQVSAATGVDEGIIVRFIREGRIDVVDPSTDPTLRRDREDEERRMELVRQLSDAPRLGTSVRSDTPVDPSEERSQRAMRSHGMRARRS